MLTDALLSKPRLMRELPRAAVPRLVPVKLTTEPGFRTRLPRVNVAVPTPVGVAVTVE